MKRVLFALVAATVISLPALAADEEICLDCHEPAEDWEGMSAEEILATASDTSIKRHADNAEFSEDQLKAIIATLLEK
ncbi:MAG: hypothetical protein V7720_13830 [Halioglobus sp.]